MEISEGFLIECCCSENMLIEEPEGACDEPARQVSLTMILLADENQYLRMATERALAREGYVVSAADEGPKAIQLRKKEKTDVFLLEHTALAEESNAALAGWSTRVPRKICAGTG